MSAPDRRHTTEVTTSRLRGGPSGGRETAVNNGQSRRPTDNQTYSLAAVTGRDGPQVRIWHARGQGFKSPQLHPRSEALSALDDRQSRPSRSRYAATACARPMRSSRAPVTRAINAG